MEPLPVAFFFLVSFTENGQIGNSPSGRVLSSKSPLKQLALDAAFIVLLRPGSFHQEYFGPSKTTLKWLIGDRESPCPPACSRSQGKPVCGSDGRSYDTNCDLERAKCKDRTLTLAHRGRCKGKNWLRIDQPLPAPTLVSEVKELTEAGQTKCRTERIQALEQAKRPQESIFIPECNDDGTFAQQIYLVDKLAIQHLPHAASKKIVPPCLSHQYGRIGNLNGKCTLNRIYRLAASTSPAPYFVKQRSSSPSKFSMPHPQAPGRFAQVVQEIQERLLEFPLTSIRLYLLQVQCHTLTGYCWCVTTDGKPVSGSSVQNKTPVCSGSVTDKPPGPPSSGRKDLVSPLLHWAALKTKCVCNRCLCHQQVDGGCVPLYHCGFGPSTARAYNDVSHKEISQSAIEHKWIVLTSIMVVSFRFFLTLNPDDGSKPTPTMETHVVPEGEEITAPTLWIKQLVYKENKQNSSNSRKSEKVPSCDQERQTAQDEARQNPREAIFIPDCGLQGLYKPVQCHQSTGYCWCVLVDTGRPIPGTSARYKKPECDSAARCPEGKKVEFITSLLDALTTDMVQAINSPTPSGGGRFVEPDPSHTLEERVVHWYFAQLDNNGSHDINKKEMKPFKRYVKKKAKPKRCARKFTDYCDLNKDKTISLQELKGCLGVNKEGYEKESVVLILILMCFSISASSDAEQKAETFCLIAR
ncbi:SPARC-related modular calcium-binding protein 1 [Labeo rohita]|uniref:SPARC-related modular calcium-binding protein 1 n=2 Tax=Labeonini TaxID=2743697 RepID=A0ABQ8LW45_LABRO|nr:SPARC-related modular calcium-binding protein 1 [Labeo rohita]